MTLLLLLLYLPLRDVPFTISIPPIPDPHIDHNALTQCVRAGCGEVVVFDAF